MSLCICISSLTLAKVDTHRGQGSLPGVSVHTRPVKLHNQKPSSSSEIFHDSLIRKGADKNCWMYLLCFHSIAFYKVRTGSLSWHFTWNCVFCQLWASKVSSRSSVLFFKQIHILLEVLWRTLDCILAVLAKSNLLFLPLHKVHDQYCVQVDYCFSFDCWSLTFLTIPLSLFLSPSPSIFISSCWTSFWLSSWAVSALTTSQLQMRMERWITCR